MDLRATTQSVLTKAKCLVATAGILAPPVDPLKLAATQGIAGVVLSKSLGVSGQLAMEGNELVIRLNANEPLARRNFTCCHEIAHTFMLDRTSAKFRFANCSGGSLEERLCDLAAAEMLMPERLFRPLAAKLEPGVEAVVELARRFGSSIRATILQVGYLAVWPVVFVGWKFTTRPGSSPKLRVCWSVKPKGSRCYVPLHAPADRASGIYATFTTSHPTCEMEELDLGTLRGKYVVESARFGDHVVSVVHDGRLRRRISDAR